MRKFLIGLIFLAMTWPGAAAALSIGLNLSDDAAELKVANRAQDGMLETQFSFLHEQNRGDVAGIALHMVDDANPGGAPLNVGIGGRALFVDTDGPNGGGLALGGHFRFTLPDMDRLGIGGELYYAPSIVAGGDLDRHLQWSLRGEYQILRQANVYIGYRQVRPAFEEGGSFRLDSGIHAGLRLDF